MVRKPVTCKRSHRKSRAGGFLGLSWLNRKPMPKQERKRRLEKTMKLRMAEFERLNRRNPKNTREISRNGQKERKALNDYFEAARKARQLWTPRGR